ncbi:MAG: type II secretion system protein GspM [Candidatus Hydrogenedentes bacterium]|nr:type II secretion system protein GspM [Candidatus Hydrogenedentota bacterium]
MALNLKISPRERRLAAVAIICLLIALLYLNVIEPVTVNWMEVRRRARDAEAELATLQQLIQKRDTIETEFKRLQGAVTSGASEQELKITLLSEVDKLANESGLLVASVKPSLVKKQKDFYRYGIELQAHGENHKLVQFLLAMQNPDHLLHTDQLTVHAGRGSAPLTFTFRISKLARLTAPAPAKPVTPESPAKEAAGMDAAP